MHSGRKLFQIFGIDIKVHYSWWFIFILLAWSLSASFFPASFPDQTTTTYWLMGTVSAFLLFFSVLLHELSHSIVAKMRKIKVESITLFFFGGVAGITDEDMKPSSEFLMAIAGPLFSLFLAGIFYIVFLLKIHPILTAMTSYLALLNVILAGFNLVPGFPLDGGRALRAILHAYYKDLRKATRIATKLGKVFAGYMIIEGILNLFGVVILIAGSVWFILLGIFLYLIAGASYEQVIIKETLEKILVRTLSRKKLTTLKPNLKFSILVKNQAKKGEDIFLVQGKNFTGLLDVHTLRGISPKQQKSITVKQAALPLKKVQTVKSSDTAYTAFKKINKQQVGVLPVKEKGKIVGFLTRNTLRHCLAWELKFGERQERRTATMKIKRKT